MFIKIQFQLPLNVPWLRYITHHKHFTKLFNHTNTVKSFRLEHECNVSYQLIKLYFYIFSSQYKVYLKYCK